MPKVTMFMAFLGTICCFEPAFGAAKYEPQSWFYRNQGELGKSYFLVSCSIDNAPAVDAAFYGIPDDMEIHWQNELMITQIIYDVTDKDGAYRDSFGKRWQFNDFTFDPKSDRPLVFTRIDGDGVVIVCSKRE